MTQAEFARLSKMNTHHMTDAELAAWRREFAARNYEDAVLVRERWLLLPESVRESITRSAATVIARGWAKAQEFKETS